MEITSIKIMKTSIAVGVMLLCSQAMANYTITFKQVGNDVVAEGSGSLNIPDEPDISKVSNGADRGFGFGLAKQNFGIQTIFLGAQESRDDYVIHYGKLNSVSIQNWKFNEGGFLADTSDGTIVGLDFRFTLDGSGILDFLNDDNTASDEQISEIGNAVGICATTVPATYSSDTPIKNTTVWKDKKLSDLALKAGDILEFFCEPFDYGVFPKSKTQPVANRQELPI